MATQPSRRSRMTGTERHEQILDVTLTIVAAESFHAATVQRIAEAAGVTRAVLYQQFGDLPGLFVALVNREIERAPAQLAEALATLPNPDAGSDPLLHMFDAALVAVDAHPDTWRLFLVPPEGAPPQLHQRLTDAENLLVQVIQAQLEATFANLPDPEYFARMIHAAGRELLRLRVVDPAHATATRLHALLKSLSGTRLKRQR